jgi:hypothetical protein
MRGGRVRLSVLTPVAADRGRWLAEAGRSVQLGRDLLATAGIEVEWVVCKDGAAGGGGDGDAVAELLAETLPPDRLVGWRTRRGISAARNAALAAATGDWVAPLDADDEVDPDGVLAAATLVRGWPSGLGWLGCNRLLVDGSRTPHWRDEPQPFGAGQLAENWTSPFWFHPNSVLFRRDVLLGAGGWPALGVNEDLAAVLLVSEEYGGRAVPVVLTRYRVWDGQEVAGGSYQEDKATAFTVIEALVNARRSASGRPPVHHPVAGPAHGRIRSPGTPGEAGSVQEHGRMVRPTP